MSLKTVIFSQIADKFVKPLRVAHKIVTWHSSVNIAINVFLYTREQSEFTYWFIGENRCFIEFESLRR